MSEAAAIADLARSGISPEQAQEAGIGYTENARLVNLSFARVPAVVIPYLDPVTQAPMTYGNPERPFVRVRYLEEVLNDDGKVVRYSQPRKSGIRLYFPPHPGWAALLDDPTMDVIITEGEKKAKALTDSGMPCIGTGGVWNWRDENDDVHPDLLRLVWEGRRLVIAYDSDAVDNPQVRHAELTLAAEMSKLGASVRIARLEPLPDGTKRGADDYIAAGKDRELELILANAPLVHTVEAAIAQLNEEVAFIESEDAVYLVNEDRRLSKSAFLSGSRFSAMKVPLTKTIKGKPVDYDGKLAGIWLAHESARRYAGTVFDPTTPSRDIVRPEGLLLNRWKGFRHEPGDVSLFLELTDHLMSESPPEMRDFPIKLMAYKAQHPDVKIPLALVFVGTAQGSGKSSWPKCVAKAFEPHGVVIQSAALKADFNEYLETSLLCVIDEAQAVHTAGARDVLKNLISEKAARLNKKHISAVQVDTYTQFILTSNSREVGSFDAEDRRMVVIGCPSPKEGEFYDRLYAWLDGGGARYLMHYLLTYDLKGWTPPKKAPLTAEKVAAYHEGLTPVQKIAHEMLTADENVVRRWLDAATAWAQAALATGGPEEQKHAKAVQAMASTIQVRPFYTAEELAALFPAISATLHGFKKLDGTPAGALSRALRNAGVNYLPSKDSVQGFMWQGQWRQYLVIADQHDWGAPLGQAEFESAMRNFGTYRERPARALQRAN